MRNLQDLLPEIEKRNITLEPESVRRIIIVYDLNMFYIGDTCIQMARLKKLKSFYPNATIDLSTKNTAHYRLVSNIVKNNPYINNYYNSDWADIRFSEYDIVICSCVPETSFLEFIYSNYGAKIGSGEMTTAFFSVIGNVGFDEMRYGAPVFPLNKKFNEYQLTPEDQTRMRANEIFLSAGEVEWSNHWLIENGMGPNDHIAVFLDSASTREKLMKLDDYFDLLNLMLKTGNLKVLIFDENGAGKKEFYECWLGEELASKLIFVEKRSIRDAICLIANKNVRLVFGPSTGLLHCASGAYNVFLQEGYPEEHVPILIGYIGKSDVYHQEDQWWGKSLVDIVFPVNNGTAKKLSYLRDVDFRQVISNGNILSCHEITSVMLTEFIWDNYSKKLENLGLKLMQ